MVAKNALFITAFALLLSPMLYADTSGMGDWDGQLSVNGSAALDGTNICLYVNGVENDRTTVGAEVSGYYLLHGVGATGDNITFKVFCEYPVNEGAQNWSASPPRHHLNLSVNHSNGPALTRIAPAETGVATGTVTLTLASNESATCRYATTSGVSYVNMLNTTNTSLGTTHSWSISAPAALTAYTYYARCLNQFNQSSDELSLSFTTAAATPISPPSGGGSTGGGGSSGGSSGTASTKETANYAIDVGSGNSCTVTITRELASGQNLSVLTTTLENVGGASCNLEEFYFADTIPDSFPAINEITFNPMYSSHEGWKVTFNFPTFAGGESKTLTYSVNGWVGSSKIKNFTVYEMGAKKKQAAPPTIPITPPAPEEPSVWVPSKPLPIPSVPNQTAPPVQPPAPAPMDFTGLILAGLVVIVILGGIGGLAVYLKGKKKRGL